MRTPKSNPRLDISRPGRQGVELQHEISVSCLPQSIDRRECGRNVRVRRVRDGGAFNGRRTGAALARFRPTNGAEYFARFGRDWSGTGHDIDATTIGSALVIVFRGAAQYDRSGI